jgi:hypothetical protein
MDRSAAKIIIKIKTTVVVQMQNENWIFCTRVETESVMNYVPCVFIMNFEKWFVILSIKIV